MPTFNRLQPHQKLHSLAAPQKNRIMSAIKAQINRLRHPQKPRSLAAFPTNRIMSTIKVQINRLRPHQKPDSLATLPTNRITSAIKALKFIYRLASSNLSVPFHASSYQNGHTFEIRPFRQPWKRWGWYMANFLVSVYALPLPLAFMEIFKNTAGSVVFSHVIVSMLGVLYFLNLLMKTDDFIAAVNCTFGLLQRYPGGRPWYTIRKVSFCIHYFASVLGISYVITMLQLLTNRRQSYFFVLARPFLTTQKMVTFVKILIVTLELLVRMWTYSLLPVYFCYFCVCIFQNQVWLKSLQSNNVRDSTKRNWIQRIGFYRQIQLLNVLHNESFRYFALGFITIISTTEVLFLYSVIKAIATAGHNSGTVAHNAIFALFALFILVLIVVIFPPCTVIEDNSRAALVSMIAAMRRRNDLLESSKSAKSLRVVKMEIGRVGCMGIETSGEMIAQILNYLLLLLSL